MFIVHTSPLRLLRSSPSKVNLKIRPNLKYTYFKLNTSLHVEKFDLFLSFLFIMRSLHTFVFRHSQKYYLEDFSKSGGFAKEIENIICQRLSRNLFKYICVKLLLTCVH